MTDSRPGPAQPRLPRRLSVLPSSLSILGSLRLAVALMFVLALVLAWATWVENCYGAAAARLGFYGAWWFTALWLVFGLNVLAAMLVRLPWKRHQLGFIVAHLGLLVLLLGCLITREAGVDALLATFEGQSSSHAYMDSQHFELTILPGAKEDESRVGQAERSPTNSTALTPDPSPASGRGEDSAGPKGDKPILVPFDPGPFNWGDYRRLPWLPWRLVGLPRGVLYDRDGIRLETLDYYGNSRLIAVPRIELRAAPLVDSPDGRAGEETNVVLSVQADMGSHMPSRRYGMGGQHLMTSGQRITFWMSGDPEETKAFLTAKPDGPLGKRGRIVLRARGKNFQWPVDDWQPGTRRALGDTGLEVELGEFKRMFSGVSLSIHRGSEPPKSMTLFAEMPGFSQQDYDGGVFGTYWLDTTQRSDDDPAAKKPASPHGPAAPGRDADRPRVDVFQGADENLYVRTWRAGKLEPAGELPADGAPLAVFAGTPDELALSLKDHVPADGPATLPEPLPPVKREVPLSRRQARARLTVDGESKEFWLANSSDDPLESIDERPPNLRKVVAGGDRRVAVRLCPDAIDLGIQVRLRQAQRRLEPGTNMPSRYSSRVDLIASEKVLCSDVLVNLNAPVDFTDPRTGRSYRLFQTGMPGPWPPSQVGIDATDTDESLIYASYFTVNYDPGRALKYLGCFLVVGGVFVRYFMPRLLVRTGAAGPGESASGVKTGALLAIALLLSAPAVANAEYTRDPRALNLDWQAWRQLPVLYGGRIMPLDTFARSMVKKICGTAEPVLTPWSETPRGRTMPASLRRIFPDGQPRRFQSAELVFYWLADPKAWESVPFLSASDSQLRVELLDLPAETWDGKRLDRVSPQQVFAATKLRERLEQLTRWQGESGSKSIEPAGVDKKARELFEAFALFRQLTSDPSAPTEGWGRFFSPLGRAAQSWSRMEDHIMRLGRPDQGDSPAQAAQRVAETARKLAALEQKADRATLAEIEPAAAAFERETAELARSMAAFRQDFKFPAEASELERRQVRSVLGTLAQRTAEMADRAAEAHRALYDSGEVPRLVFALDARASEADRYRSEASPWVGLPMLLVGPESLMKEYPQAELRAVRKTHENLANVFRGFQADTNDSKDRAGRSPGETRFREAMNEFAAAVRDLGEAVTPLRDSLPIREKDEVILAATAYPPPGEMTAEIVYNQLDPFYWAWLLAAASAVVLAASFIRPVGKPLFWTGIALLCLGQAMVLTGFGLRGYILGWTPVTGMFETILFAGLCDALLAVGLTLLPPREVYARRPLALVGAITATVLLAAAYYVPAFPKDIKPIMPVLRSNFWLAIHVKTIVAGYGVAALAYGLGMVALGYYLFARWSREAASGRIVFPAACATLGGLIYRLLQVTILLLAIGTILGGMWADVSWGRFWGWDPKEVWALVTILVYMIVLHGRHVWRLGDFGMAAGSVIGVVAVGWTWYGVSFLMSAGKHSYAEGSGGKWFLMAFLAANAVYLAAVIVRYAVAHLERPRSESQR